MVPWLFIPRFMIDIIFIISLYLAHDFISMSQIAEINSFRPTGVAKVCTPVHSGQKTRGVQSVE
jgi:hypothetical protein